MSVTIFDYLPPRGSLVRYRAEHPNGEGKTTRLVLVEDLPALCSRTPKAKISVSYAAYKGGQKSEHVVRAYSVCIDLDGNATTENIVMLQRRFPGAAVIHGNGVTLLYQIKAGAPWSSAAIIASQIGWEAENLTGLKFDVRTLLRSDGTPAKHEGHLFRFHAGWASKRDAAVASYFPLGGNSLYSDAADLNYPRLSSDCDHRHAITERTSTMCRGAKPGGGSQEYEHRACSDALGIRARVLSSGGSIDLAVKQASSATGKTQKEIQALFSRLGYELGSIASYVKGQHQRVLDDEDVGVVGLESSSRCNQRSRTMSANFGHSLQGFWDVKCGPEVAFEGAITFPEFEIFRKWFELRFGSDWQQAMREDIQRCWEKFGQRRALQQVSRHCFAMIREALKSGPISSLGIVRESGYSLRQVKRAMKELLAKGEVTFTGKTKAKVWRRNPCHTEELLRGGERSILVSIDLKPLTRQHAVGGTSILWSRDWTKPRGCPRNTCKLAQRENVVSSNSDAERLRTVNCGVPITRYVSESHNRLFLDRGRGRTRDSEDRSHMVIFMHHVHMRRRANNEPMMRVGPYFSTYFGKVPREQFVPNRRDCSSLSSLSGWHSTKRLCMRN